MPFTLLLELLQLESELDVAGVHWIGKHKSPNHDYLQIAFSSKSLGIA